MDSSTESVKHADCFECGTGALEDYRRPRTLACVAGALKLIHEEAWNPPWLWCNGVVGWSIHDALYQMVSEGFPAVDYTDCCWLLSDALGEPVFEWERQPNRRQSEIEELFRRVLDGKQKEA